MKPSDLLPGTSVRAYTSKSRRSYMDGVVTELVEEKDGLQVRVWFTKRIVNGQTREVPERQAKQWVDPGDLEVLETALSAQKAKKRGKRKEG